MSASPQLPPSARDFLVYERLVVDGASTRTAAGEFRLSQTRVRQIARRVVEWLSTTLPQDPDLDDAARLRFGQHLAADRLETLYRDAMTDWRSTRQPKFAGLAVRVALAQARLPAFPGTLQALAADAIEGPCVFPSHREVTDAERGIHSQDGSSNLAASAAHEPSSHFVLAPSSPASPPVEDCSAAPPSIAPSTAHSPAGRSTTPSSNEACDTLPPAARAARSAFLAPAHLPAAQDNDSPVTQIKITPEKLGLSTTNVLSRKERRRLRRLAATR